MAELTDYTVVSVTMTKKQCRELADFLRTELFRLLQDNNKIYDMQWLCDFCDLYKELEYKGAIDEDTPFD